MKITSSLLFRFCISCPVLNFAQVGINTTNPQATLDINGNLKIRSIPETSVLPGYKVLAINESSFEVTNVSPALLSFPVNTSAAKVKSVSGLSLLSLDLSLFNSWNILKFDTVEINPTGFTSTPNDFYYTVPTTGKYVIDFYFRNNTLLTLGVQTTTRIGILKTTSSNVSSLIDSKLVTVVSVLLASYYYENIDSIY